ncbi:MAG: S8 family serine peptidase [Bacteroidales bacterium]|nr:S8 family serine peptidase [Bacteroidales bacterium]
MIRNLLATILFFAIPVLLSAQRVDKNAIDGEIYFQLKPSAAVNTTGVQKSAYAIQNSALIAGLKSSFKIQTVASPFINVQSDQLQRTYLLRFDNIYAVDSIISELKKNPAVEYAEKAPLFHLLYTPDDPEYNQSLQHRWYLNLIQASDAWNVEKGSSRIKVAVLDNGIDISHPDLTSKIVAAIDLANGDNNPTPPSKTMEWSHGTHVSGLVGAATNNGVGIASIGFNVSLMAVKISSDTTDGGTMSYGYQGIIWAADHGANVINMSWGGSGYYQTGQNVVDYAYNKGCTLVAAAGNDSDSVLIYPAGYKHVISVASVDYDDVKSNFSSYNSAVDVSAPGGYDATGYSIYSTVYMDGTLYQYMQGTSMATPIVSGLAGLMMSADTTLTPEKLEAIMKATSDNIDAKNPDYPGQLGAGRINAYKAVVAVKDSLSKHTVVANFKADGLYIPQGGTVIFTDESTGSPSSWVWSFPGGSPNSSTDQNPAQVTYMKPGVYPVSLTASDGTNSNTETKTSYITVYSLASGAWEAQATGFSQASRGIDYISIVNENVAWADAYDGSGSNDNILEFTRTSDGGTTWTPGTYTGVPAAYKVTSIAGTDRDTAWISTYNTTFGSSGAIFKTVDGGASWVQQTTAGFNDASSFPNFVYFWDGKKGICQGDPVSSYFEIYTTTDGGTTWNRVPSANIPKAQLGEYGYTDLYAVYNTTIWFGTNKGRVFKSVDNGQHWTASSTGMAEVNNIGFHDGTTGIVTYVQYDQNSGTIADFQMKKTSDGGQTWATVNPTGSYYKSDIAVIKDEPGLVISTGNSQDLAQCGSAYSLDDGQTWVQLDDSVQYTTVKFLNRTVGWAGGFNQNAISRGIWKWLKTDVQVGQIPDKDQLQVYPNPSHGQITLHLPDAKSSIEVSVYNLLGKRVMYLNKLPVNVSNLYPLNLKSLERGIYILRVKQDQSTTTKKLVIE